MKSYFLAAIAAFIFVSPAKAQVTNITPDTAPGLSLGTTVNQNGTTFTIDGGTTAGANLFHSFNNFDLGAGDTAAWVYSAGDPASITNVVNRITGGTPSSIFGTIDSTAIPNADFYFINPAGIVFSGPDAQVNVPAAAYFSTASELHFADGATFKVSTPSGSTLSVAAPKAFGFIGNEGDILVSAIENIDDTPFLAQAGTLGLSAANIAFDNGFVGGSELWLTAVGVAPNQVALDGTTAELAAGRIDMVNSWLQTWAADCYDFCLGVEGYISLNAGAVFLDSTGIVADFASTTDEGGTSFVRIVGNDSIDLYYSFILADGYDTASAGDIDIHSGGDIQLVDTTILAYTQGSGEAGQISIDGYDVLIAGGSVGSETFGSGDAGAVLISADNLLSIANGFIATTTWDLGNAGAIVLDAPIMVLSDSLVSSESYGFGNAGAVTIFAPTSLDASFSTISSAAFGGEADAGKVEINAGSFNAARTVISSEAAFYAGDAGTVIVNVAGDFSLTDLSFVSTEAYNGHQAGDIAVLAENILLKDSYLSSSADSNADAGNISITARNVLSGDLAAIQSSAGESYLPDGDTGTAGGIDLSAQSIDFRNVYVSTTAQGGSGTIGVAAPDITLFQTSFDAITFGAGDAGNISVNADRLAMDQSGFISSTIGAGDGGSVVVRADTIEMIDSGFSSTTEGEGDAGTVDVVSNSMSMRGGSIITSTNASGDAGEVLIDTGDFVLDGTLILSQSNFDGSGDAGSIHISAEDFLITNGANLTTSTFGTGNAGNIFIDAETLILTDNENSGIYSRSYHTSTGDAGNLIINVDQMVMDSGSVIDLTTLGSGDGGSITIKAGQLLVDDFASINSGSTGSGEAGSILIASSGVTISNGGSVSSNSAFGAAGSITFDMAPGSLLTLEGAVNPGVIETSSGPGTGGVITVASPLAIISNGGSILALGEQGGANVQIDADYFIASSDRPNLVQVDGNLTFSNAIYDVSAGTNDADLEMIDASGVLQGQCSMVRATGEASQLNLRATGPYGVAKLPALGREGNEGGASVAVPGGACQ